ncbi:MAG: PQQ-binding-like beta-propeller repeat protein [Xanthomonadales bacterium]|jgi:outer membrane protein assembly factor BamB|nr:PQQ-binding-like beta-propeller repeat protein [Xanthomonadales bacterium]
MRILTLVAALLAVVPPASATQPTPLWSSVESEAIPLDTDYGRTAHVLLEDGSAFMVAAETRRAGLAGTLRLAADGVAVPGQFGHQPVSGGRLSPEAVLATRADRVLLAMTELDPPRPLVVLVDSAGEVQWARPRFGRQARFLANGDVLLAAGNELMRLKGSDGDLLWVRNLLDLRPNPTAVDFQLPAEVGAAVRLSLHYREFTPAGDPRDPDPLLVSLDSASGALQWQRPREPATLPVLERCAPVGVGADQVHAYVERGATQVDAVVERRRGDTGARQWSTRIPAVAYTQDDEPCALVATSSLLAFSSRDGVAESTLFALNHDGVLQWRTSLPTAAPAVLRPAADGALLVARQQLLSAGFGTIAERRRASDGTALWSVEIPGRAVDWRTVGNELHLAWSVDDGAAELHLQRRAAASGALLAEQVAVAEGLALRPADVEILDGIPYALLTGLDADRRGLRLRRLDPDSGTPLWSQSLQLAEPPLQVTGASLHAGGSGRLVALVYYTVDRSPAPPESRQAVLSVDLLTGALYWQAAMVRRSLQFGPGGAEAQPVATAIGSVYVRSSLCLNPPSCGETLPRVVRLSAVDGQEVWSVVSPGNLLGARGDDLVVDRGGNFATLALMGATDGSDLWTQLMPANSLLLSALPTATGDLHVMRQVTASGRQRTQLDRRSGVNGSLSWTIDPGVPTASVRGAVLTRLADGDLLLSARMSGAADPAVSRPLLARVDGVTGVFEWLSTPAPQTDRWWTVRPITSTGSVPWARNLRLVGDSFYNVEERYTLTPLNLDSGAIGVEHQYTQTYDPPLPSPALGTGFVSTIRGDRSALVENRRVDARGLGTPRIERWPAPGTASGDLALRQVGSEQPIRALGPSTEVVIEVDGAATAVDDIGIGFASTVDGLKAQLRACALVVGSGTCPPALGSTLDQTLSLGAGARMRLHYEIHDPEFQPKQARAGNGARGLFHLDPPFAWGDTDPGNQVVVIHVSLGGMSNGFE